MATSQTKRTALGFGRRVPIFSNPWPHEEHGVGDIFKWKFGIGPQEKPLIPDAPNLPPDLVKLTAEEISQPPEEGWRVTWLGHASFLVQGSGISLLIDPVFSEFCSPIAFSALRRQVATPCQISDLPPIHTVLLTHAHYDHLDLSTLRQLGDGTRFIIAEGHAEWLKKKLGTSLVSEVPWHDTISVAPGITVAATPAQHFTARTPFDRNRGHWCGWLLKGAGRKLWHAGDSGYCPAFQEIGERYGPIDFAMIPIGAYQPRRIMKPMHMNPEEAVQTFEEARCRRAVAMHWGTFVLTDEPLQEPPIRLRQELERRNLDENLFTAGKVGGTWTI
jgi:N-acyl-phosphatidylethanolamine-hydrolysing phospholipase D